MKFYRLKKKISEKKKSEKKIKVDKSISNDKTSKNTNNIWNSKLLKTEKEKGEEEVENNTPTKEEIKDTKNLLPVNTNKIVDSKTSENVVKKPTKFIDASKLKQFSSKLKRKSDSNVNKKQHTENDQNLKVLNSNELKINDPKTLELKKNSSKLRTKASSFMMFKKEKTLINRAFDKTTFDKIDASLELKPADKKLPENISDENKPSSINLDKPTLKTAVNSCIVEEQTKKDNTKTDHTLPQIKKTTEVNEKIEPSTELEKMENKLSEEKSTNKAEKCNIVKGIFALNVLNLYIFSITIKTTNYTIVFRC